MRGTLIAVTLALFLPLRTEAQAPHSITVGPDYPLASTPSSETSPAIGRSDDGQSFCVAWNDNGERWKMITFRSPDQVRTSSERPMWSLEYEFPEKFGSPWDLNWRPELEDRQREERVSSFFGHLALSFNLAEVYNYFMPDMRPMTTTGHVFRFFVDSSGTWAHISEQGTPFTRPYSVMNFTRHECVGYLPRRREFILGTKGANWSYDFTSSGEYRTLYSIDSSGKGSWTYSTAWIRQPSIWLPVDSAEFIIVQADLALRVRGIDTLTSFPLPSATGRPRILLLDTDLFLRSYTPPEDPMTFVAQIWTIEGELLGSDTIAEAPQPLRAGNYQVAWRSLDHVLGMFWGTDSTGVQALLYDPQMRPITSRLQLSQSTGRTLNPGGIFAGDTLVVIWEDHRHDNPDIYAATLNLPIHKTGDVKANRDEGAGLRENRAGKTKTLQSLHPNPARTRIHLSFDESGTGMILIEGFDMLGRKVFTHSIEEGTNATRIDLPALQPGSYILRWSTTDCSGNITLLIVP